MQETASQSVLIALSDESRAKISGLSDASEGLLTLSTELLRVKYKDPTFLSTAVTIHLS